MSPARPARVGLNPPSGPSTLTVYAPVIACTSDSRIFNTAYNGSGGSLSVGSVATSTGSVGIGDHHRLRIACPSTSSISYVVGPRAAGPWTTSPFGNADWISYYSERQPG